MNKQFIVVDRLKEWAPFYPVEHLISVEEYLGMDPSPDQPAQIINLCHDYKYQGKGYYCSLLAEARGDRVIPSVRTINDLSKRKMYTLGLSSLEKILQKNREHLGRLEADRCRLRIFFGTTCIEDLRGLARQLFDLFPCPLLEIRFRQVASSWVVEEVRTFSIEKLDDAGQDEFAAALDHFSSKVWKRPRRKKNYAYDLALLADARDPMPPSNRKAIEAFVRAGHQIGIDVEIVGKHDYSRLTEFDGLFIRETTAVNHHTYEFAQKAEFLNIPVIDDPNSILKCANKVYLTELLRENEVATPRTLILYRDDPRALDLAAEELGFPLVLKIPDGSFSRGVHRVSDMTEFKATAGELFTTSVLVLAQEFMYTDFDWRIGMLGGRPLFACKYFMSEGHWQIYNHAARGSRRAGGCETIAVEQAPAEVIKLAVKAAGLIGSGLYGVDIKQSNDRFSVIEVNDNPNVDAGVEDAHLGKLLYHRILEHFFSQLERYRYG